jgi:hypothetical protein
MAYIQLVTRNTLIGLDLDVIRLLIIILARYMMNAVLYAINSILVVHEPKEVCCCLLSFVSLILCFILTVDVRNI